MPSSAGEVTLAVTSGPTGAVVPFRAEGFKAGASVEVWLFSDPVLLTTTTANSSGAVNTSVSIPAGTPVGSHRIEVRGTAADGSLLIRSAPFTVVPTSAAVGSDDLVRTGGSALRLALWAALLLLCGRVAVVLGRPSPGSARHEGTDSTGGCR